MYKSIDPLPSESMVEFLSSQIHRTFVIDKVLSSSGAGISGRGRRRRGASLANNMAVRTANTDCRVRTELEAFIANMNSEKRHCVNDGQSARCKIGRRPFRDAAGAHIMRRCFGKRYPTSSLTGPAYGRSTSSDIKG